MRAGPTCLCKGNGLLLLRGWLVTHVRETILDHSGLAWSKRQFSDDFHTDQLPNPANTCANSYCSPRSGHLSLEQSTGTICSSISLQRGAGKQDKRPEYGQRWKKDEGVLLTSSTLWLIFSFLAHENLTGPAVSQPSSCLITENFSPVSLPPKPWSRTKASSCARCLLTFRVPWKRPTKQPTEWNSHPKNRQLEGIKYGRLQLLLHKLVFIDLSGILNTTVLSIGENAGCRTLGIHFWKRMVNSFKCWIYLQDGKWHFTPTTGSVRLPLLPALAQNLALLQQERKTSVFLFIFYSCLCWNCQERNKLLPLIL